MGALMRAHNWADTELGEPCAWPSTLKTVVRLILTSNHPMFIWWGSDLTQFYNDAYRRTLGPERHPSALGQGGRQCWAEAWHLVGNDVDRIMAGGTAAWYEDRLIPLTRFGKREDVWWTYGYSPIEDEAGVRGVLAICNDVTPEHVSREGLKQTYHTLTDTMDAGFCVIEIVRDAAGRATDYVFIETNRAFDLQTGVKDTVGKSVRQAIPGIEQRWIDIYGEIAATGNARRFTEHSAAMNRWFNVFAKRIDHTDSERVAILFTDITDRKAAENALRVSELQARETASKAEQQTRRLDALLEAAPVGIVYADEVGGLVIANAMNQQLWGPHPTPINQTEYTEWKGWWADGSERHGMLLQPADWAMSRALRGEDVDADMVEIEPFGAPGERRVMIIRAAAIRDEHGKITGAVAANMDVTEQVRAQRALRDSEAKFRTIADTMPQMVWAATPKGENEYSNQRWREFCGVSEHDILGHRWEPLIEPGDLPVLLKNWQHSLRTGDRFELEHRILHRSGNYRWVLNRALPVRNDDGDIVRWMGTVTDIHDQRLLAEELKLSNSRKDEFLAMLAHELRNPLAPISTAAQLLKLSLNDPKRIVHASDVIGRQVRHMTELVDDLLDVSRVNRGLVELERNAVDIKTVIYDAIEQAKPLIERKNHTLVTRLGSVQAHVTGDRKRLVQVMANLLTNAAKYTPESGVISVTADIADGRVTLTVEDNGIGIEAGLLPHIFELFTQARRTPDRAQGGLGLGLALVRSMIAHHDGTVEARSPGLALGSTFIVTLPCHALPAQERETGEPQPAAIKPGGARRIMIVDDNRDAAESLGLLLSLAGHETIVAHSAGEAVRRSADAAIDVYILDIGLPDFDGYALLKTLRTLPVGAYATMIALSGYGQGQDIEASRRAGFDHHLVKPVEVGRLHELLDASVRHPAATPPVAGGA